jgi:hypothetical protein
MNRCWYLNALFDLELGGFDTGRPRRPVVEMQPLFLLVGCAGDRAIVECELPDEYCAYLRDAGLVVARPRAIDEVGEPCRGEPWGWNRRACDTFARAGATCDHPSLEVVRTVNSREFGHALGAALDAGVAGGVWCESVDEIQDALGRMAGAEAVVKPAFGNAGAGFVHVTHGRLDAVQAARLRAYIDRGGVGACVEPWLDRLHDISSRYAIGKDGAVMKVGHHRALSNRSGAFFADWMEPRDACVEPWRETLDDTLGRAATALAAAGYWGPVGFDSFVYRHNATHRLAAMIEINARHAMSTVAYALRDQLAPDRPSLFRFIGKRRHRLPPGCDRVRAALGGDAFSARDRRGALLLTPPRIRHAGEQWRQPGRSAFFVCAETAEETLRLDERLRRVFAPPENRR